MVVDAEERDAMVRVAAYYLAEQRGFTPEGAMNDWLLAEQRIDQMLNAIRNRGLSRDQFERIGLRNALHLWETD
jgi:hypothetical protein